MMRRGPLLVAKLLLPLVILATSAMAARAIMKRAPKAKKRGAPPAVEAPTARVLITHRAAHRVDVSALGVVAPARQLQLRAETTGRVTSLHRDLSPGATLRRGQVVARLDTRDLRVELKQAQAAEAQAKARLQLEEGAARAAAREWRAFKKQYPEAAKDPTLAKRAPQGAIAREDVKLATLRVDRAKDTLRRATVRAPFHALVRARTVEVGQLVSAQTPLADLVGTDAYHIRASLPVADMAHLLDARGALPVDGLPATVAQTLGGHTTTYPARLLRLLGDVEPQTGMVRALVQVNDPLNLDSASKSARPPLLLGGRVRVHIKGAASRDAIQIPRAALREDRVVHVCARAKTETGAKEAAHGVLEIRDVTWDAKDRDNILITRGIEPGERVILNALWAPVAGMKLRCVVKNTANTTRAGDTEAR